MTIILSDTLPPFLILLLAIWLVLKTTLGTLKTLLLESYLSLMPVIEARAPARIVRVPICDCEIPSSTMLKVLAVSVHVQTTELSGPFVKNPGLPE